MSIFTYCKLKMVDLMELFSDRPGVVKKVPVKVTIDVSQTTNIFKG